MIVKKNYLAIPKYEMLKIWIESNLKNLDGYTVPEVAEQVTEQLGFPVTQANVMRIRQEYGFTWRSPRKVKVPYARGGNNDKARLLAIAIEDLYKVFDIPVPGYLSAIIGNQPLRQIQEQFELFRKENK